MTGSRLGVAAVTSGVVCVLVASLVVAWVGHAPDAGSPNHVPGMSRDLPAAAVLRSWDRRRAAAYAAGAPGRLRALYVRGAGSSDVDLLDRYRSRGWRVLGMRMQVLALTVTERDTGRLRLRVTDRLTGAVAVRPGERVPLPRDRASTRRVTLLRGRDAVWRVAEVRPG
jgi:hypothetical protein